MSRLLTHSSKTFLVAFFGMFMTFGAVFFIFPLQASAATIQCISTFDNVACSFGSCSYSYYNCTGDNPSCMSSGSVWCPDGSTGIYCVGSETCSPGTAPPPAVTCSGGASPGSVEVQACGSGTCAGSQTRTCGSTGSWGGWSACSSDGNNCSDGNSCTVGDSCSGGSCSSGPNSPVNGTCSTFSATCGSWSFTCDAAHCGQTPTRSCTYNLATTASCGGSNPSCGGYTESGATCGACAQPRCSDNPPNICGTYPNCSAPSGCDNACGSTKTLDACGTCGGNVSSITCNAPNPTACGQTTTGTDSCGETCVKSSPSCGQCTSDSACGDGNICTTDTCVNPGTPSSYCSHPTLAGTHSQCSGTTCSSVANTSTSCTGTCTNNTQCGGCVANTGTACNDGNSCTTGETIQCSGACGGGVNVPTSSNWSSWSAWSVCSNGSQTRTRTCQGTATCGGSNNCIGSSTETQSCGTIRCFDSTGCDDNNSCTSDVCINAGTTSSYCTNNASGTHTVCQSNACVSVANSLSSCTNSCSSSANCTSCAANTGQACNDGNSCTSGETVQCNGTCGGGSNTPTDSNWSAWSSWSACSGGNQTRTRTCVGTATCGGTNNCTGSATETRSCTVPNQAICDGAWRELPGGGVTPSQAVGIYVPQAPAVGDPHPTFDSQFHDGIVAAVRAIGSSSSIFYQTCLFGGSSTCAFSGTWQDIGASTPYPPALTLGWSLDVRLKDAWNNMYYKVNRSSGWDANWSGWYVDPGNIAWGQPFRTQDKNGRYWQFARNVYDGVEYSCGPSVCVPLRFNAAVSGISTNTVNTGGSFTATCDYGVKSIDSIVVDAPAGITCTYNSGSSFGNANPTSAVFNCSVGGSASSGAVSCRLRNDTSSFTCSQTNIIGNIAVHATQYPAISLSSLTPFSGYSGGPMPTAKTLTITNSGSATLNWTAARTGTGTWCSVAPASGSLAPGASTNVSVSVSAPTNVGTFSDCSIRVSDPNATNSPQTAPVSYTVSTCEAGLTPSSNATISNITSTGYRINWTAFSGNHDNQTRIRIASSLNETGAEQVGTYTGTFAYSSCPQAVGSSPTACVAYTTLAGVQNTYTLSGAAAGTTYYNRLPAICYDKNPDGSNGAMHYKDYVFTASTSGSVCNTSPGSNFMKGCVYDGTNFNTLSNVSISEPALSSPTPDNGSPVPIKYWGLSGPDPSNVDTFSIRWKGTFNFTAGNYVFTSGSDDGRRVYFDDNLDGNPDSGYIINSWIDQGYNAVSTSPIAVSAGSHTLVMEYYDNGVDSHYGLSWAKQIDPYSLCTGTGALKRDYWTGISGTAVSNLTSSANYPNTPSGSTQPTSFEAPTNWADNYGQRMYGLVNAPQTGSYTFYIASDDASELWLSTNSDMANKVRVARVDSYTGSRAWTSFGIQASGGINLTAGQNYYIEAIHKEGGGGDNLAVGWKLPGSSTIDVIPGACLSLYTPPVGTINVRYTIDGVAQSANQSINYSISGPTAVSSGSYTVNGTSSHTNRTAGNYTFTYNSGVPAGKQFSSVTPSGAQALAGGGSLTFTVNFVTSAPTGPGTPPGGAPGTPIDADNSTCGVIRLTWSDNSSNETGFKIFRGTTADSAAATLVTTTAANATSYTYTPPDTNPYYYFVAATIGGSNDSARIGTNALDAPISAVACQANLTGSDKDISAVNGTNTSANACDGAFQGSYIGATAVKFYEGDTISFRINACNTSGQGPATQVSILDTLTNLEQPTNVKLGGSNMAKDADCSTPSVSNHYSYCPGTKVVRFYLGTINTGSSAYVTFDSLISSASSVASRFNNSSTITYTKDINGTVGSRNANTPWLPYYSSTGVPSRTETAPK